MNHNKAVADAEITGFDLPPINKDHCTCIHVSCAFVFFFIYYTSLDKQNFFGHKIGNIFLSMS